MSLRRLGVERIDLWQLHRIDAKTPREEQFGEIKAFVDEGLALQVGLSEVGVDEIKAAQDAGLPIASVQNRYNLGDRAAEDVLDFCEAQRHRLHPVGAGRAGTLARPGGAAGRGRQGAPGASPPRSSRWPGCCAARR